ncbi:hypothetical protein DMUE_0079 [Dictyocoela muelleri]|nr:hypothetical protein DMUE_0079 [Dictyocoela muelleri]
MLRDTLRWFSFYTSIYALLGFWMTYEQEKEFGKFSLSSFIYITNISLLVNMISVIISLWSLFKSIRSFFLSFNFCITLSVFIFYWPLYFFVPNSLNVQKLDPKISFFDDMCMHGFPCLVSLFEMFWGSYEFSYFVSFAVILTFIGYNRFLNYYTDNLNGDWVYPIFNNNNMTFKNTFFALWVIIVLVLYYFITMITKKEQNVKTRFCLDSQKRDKSWLSGEANKYVS